MTYDDSANSLPSISRSDLKNSLVKGCHDPRGYGEIAITHDDERQAAIVSPARNVKLTRRCKVERSLHNGSETQELLFTFRWHREDAHCQREGRTARSPDRARSQVRRCGGERTGRGAGRSLLQRRAIFKMVKQSPDHTQ